MEKRSKIRELMFGKNYWEKKNWNKMAKEFVKIPELDTNELEKVYKEMEDLDSQYWKYRENYLELSLIQKMKGELTRGSSILTIPCFEFQCPSKQPPLLENYYYGFYNFQKTQVWIGLYSTITPNINYKIGDLCTTYYTTDMTYYWNWAKSVKPNTLSIQIKWFYNATVLGYQRSLIWEGNKNASTQWYTYGSYTTINPKNGSYQITVYEDVNACCLSGTCKWCNTHCSLCFGCDASGDQNFSYTNTIP